MISIELEAKDTVIDVLELKDHIRFHSNDDLYLKRLIKSATTVIENITGRSFLTKTYKFIGSGDGVIELPYPPFVELIEIQSLSPKQYLKRYKIDETKVPTKIFFHAPLKTLQIIYKAGYGDTKNMVPESIRHAVLTLCTSMHENRDTEPKIPMNLISDYIVHRLF